MRPLALRWVVAGAAAQVYISAAALVRAQDAASTGAPPVAPATPTEVKPPLSALTGAANLTAAEHAVRAEAAQLKAEARLAKLEAFHPSEFGKTRDAARKVAADAELRRQAAEKLVTEATARRDSASAAVAKFAKASNEDAESEEALKAAAELATRESELDAAIKSKDKTVDAAILAGLAAGRADEAVEASNIALALTSAYTTAMERATTQAGDEQNKTLAYATELRIRIDEKKVEAFEKWLQARTKLDEFQQLLPALNAAKERAEPAGPESDSETLLNGSRLSWGITGSLLRFQTQRSQNLPGRNRNFRPRYEFVPGEAGFQFLVEPSSSPWRLQMKNGDTLQLMSWGGLLLASLGEDKALERGSLSFGATLVFFKNAIGLGGGFDLYRGIPVQGADGAPGGDTAFTGVLAWAFAQEGEVTAENAFVVVTVNLSSLIGALSGKENGDAAH
jgi:hypothetical protein